MYVLMTKPLTKRVGYIFRFMAGNPCAAGKPLESEPEAIQSLCLW